MLNNVASSEASAPYSVADPQHIVAGVTALITERLFQCERFRCRAWFILAVSARAAHGKNHANIKEIIADGGSGFH